MANMRMRAVVIEHRDVYITPFRARIEFIYTLLRQTSHTLAESDHAHSMLGPCEVSSARPSTFCCCGL